MMLNTSHRLLRCLAGLLLAAAAASAGAQGSEMSWNLEQIVRSEDDPVELRDGSGRLV